MRSQVLILRMTDSNVTEQKTTCTRVPKEFVSAHEAGFLNQTLNLEADGHAASDGTSGLNEVDGLAVLADHRHVALCQQVPQVK